MMNIKFERIRETAIEPDKAYSSDAGFDLYADLVSDTVINSFDSLLVPTGFRIKFIDQDYWNAQGYLCEAQVRSKSGLALKNKLFVLNSPGTIDQDYSGEIMVILFNLSKEDQIIKKNQKVAQLVISLIPYVTIKEASLISKRGDNGFGSSGILCT